MIPDNLSLASGNGVQVNCSLFEDHLVVSVMSLVCVVMYTIHIC